MATDKIIDIIAANAADDELRVLAAVLKRANDRPAIVVTVRQGVNGTRRYVVAQEDEPMFADLPDGPIERADRWDGPQFWFGAQWLRGYGRVDEMYRTLSASEITRVARVNRAKVWGE